MPRGGQPGTPGYKGKPFKLNPPPKKSVLPQLHRSSALAQREGGIGARPHLSASQRRTANKLVSGYEHGASAGNLGHALSGLGHAYKHNPIYRNPIVGHKGLLGGLEDLGKTFDPIALGETLNKTGRHPLSFRSSTDLNAGMVVGGPGRGMKVARPRDPLVIPSEKTIKGSAGETRIEQRTATLDEAKKRLRALDRQLEGFYKQVEKKIGHPLAEADIAQEIGRSRALTGGRARGKSVEGRITGAPVKRASVKQELRGAALQHLEKIAERNPDHPSVQRWASLEAERSRLANDLHSHMPGEAPRLPDIAEVKLTPEMRIRRQVLGAAKMGNREVEALRKEERAARVEHGSAAYEDALARSGSHMEGYKAFLRHQRGTMPELGFDKLTDASKADIDRLAGMVNEHPGLKRWEKVSAQGAIERLVSEGRRPRKRELEHLETVFGPQATENLIHATLKERALGIIGIPRSLMASFDVSAPFRQNLMGFAMEPRIGARNLPGMYRSFGSEGHYAADLDKIHAHPDYELAIDSGLSISELAGVPGKREEAFPSQYAEQLNVPIGGGHSIGPGHVVRGSGRAYTGYLDNGRFQMFTKYVDILRKKGIDPESYPALHGVSKVARLGHEYPLTYAEGIAKLVNSATGRGNIKNVESWGPFMNVMFFSPRLMYSRLNFLDPSWYFRLDPFSRRQALKGVARLATTSAGTFALAAWLGAEIGHDPRSADFAKIRIGNTRVDILGGFQQYVRLGAQLWTGQIVSSTTGKVTDLGGGFGQKSRLSILARFAQGKTSPPASLVIDFFRGTDFAGQPFQWKYEVLSRITPLVAQDTLDLYRSSGSAPLSALAYAVSAHGIGMQTYSNPIPGEFKDKMHGLRKTLSEEGMKTLGAKGAHLPPELDRQLKLHFQRYSAYKDANLSNNDPDFARKAYEVDLGLLKRQRDISPGNYAKALKWAETASHDDLLAERRTITSEYFPTDWLNSAIKQLKDKGVKVTVPR